MCRLSSCRLVLVFLAALTLLVPPLLAQDKTVHPTPEDLARFAQLPVRFNGRVTTYEVVAKNYLRQFSGRDVCYDQVGKEYPAVRWLLDVMAVSDTRDNWRIIQIENARLLAQLELKTDDRREVHRQHFSLMELRPKFAWIEEKGWEIGRLSGKRQADEQAIFKLYAHLLHCMKFEMSFFPSPAINRDNSDAAIKRLEFLKQQPMPRFVFSAGPKEWSSFPRATLREALAGDDAKRQNLLYQQLRDLLSAYEKQDAQAFQQGLDQYAQSLKTSEASYSPFMIAPSNDWLEVGVSPERALYFYRDADAFGHKIVDMHLAEDAGSQFFVNHFVGQDISPVELHNSWRISLGLVPLSEADAKATWKPFEVAGRKAILLDDSTPDGIEIPHPRRFLTAVVQEEGHTFVFAWSGEKDILKTNWDAFEELMNSIHLKSPKELATWFPGEAQTPAPPEDRFLAAVVPDGQQIWIFATSGPDQAVLSHREKFIQFLKSLELQKTKEQRTQLDWELPDGWAKIGEYGEATLFMGQDENALPMTVTPLGDVRDDSVPVLVDHWATKLGMDPLPEKVRKDAIKEISISGRKAFLIELQKPREAIKDSEITYQTPNGWKQLPPVPFLQGSFEKTQGEASAKFIIAALPANNNLAANINRWRTQLDLPMQTEKEILENVKDQTVDNQQGKLIELHNTDTKQRILAAIVTSGEKDWFFKLMGDAVVIEQERQAFEEFLKTVKFAPKDQTKTEEEKP